jgi:hypothetical protein
MFQFVGDHQPFCHICHLGWRAPGCNIRQVLLDATLPGTGIECVCNTTTCDSDQPGTERALRRVERCTPPPCRNEHLLGHILSIRIYTERPSRQGEDHTRPARVGVGERSLVASMKSRCDVGVIRHVRLRPLDPAPLGPVETDGPRCTKQSRAFTSIRPAPANSVVGAAYCHVPEQRGEREGGMRRRGPRQRHPAGTRRTQPRSHCYFRRRERFGCTLTQNLFGRYRPAGDSGQFVGAPKRVSVRGGGGWWGCHICRMLHRGRHPFGARMCHDKGTYVP